MSEPAPQTPHRLEDLSASFAPLKAIGLMVLAVGFLTVNDGIAKWLSQSVPIGQIMTLRGLMLIALLLAWSLMRNRPDELKVRAWRPQTVRGLLMVLSTVLFVTSLSLMPIADAISLSFAGPLFATAIAAILLKEKVGWRRWSAVAVGFSGVLIMLRPTPELIRLAAFLPVGAAFLGAFRDVMTRKMGTGGETTVSMLLVSTFMVVICGLFSLPYGWVEIGWWEVGLFAASAFLVGLAQGFMIESVKLGQIGLVGPFKYTSVVWAVIGGIVVWGDVPDIWTWTGATIVIGSGLFIWRRELQLARARRS